MKIRRTFTITLDNGEEWEKTDTGWTGRYVENGRVTYLTVHDTCPTGRLITALAKELEGHLHDASLR